MSFYQLTYVLTDYHKIMTISVPDGIHDSAQSHLDQGHSESRHRNWPFDINFSLGSFCAMAAYSAGWPMSSGPADAIRLCWDGWFVNWHPHECQDPGFPCRILNCSKCHSAHLSVVSMLLLPELKFTLLIFMMWTSETYVVPTYVQTSISSTALLWENDFI